MMLNVLKLMQNQFSDFYFSSCENSLKIDWGDDVTKMTIIQKNRREEENVGQPCGQTSGAALYTFKNISVPKKRVQARRCHPRISLHFLTYFDRRW